jgi:putative DNA primase/helicase
MSKGADYLKETLQKEQEDAFTPFTTKRLPRIKKFPVGAMPDGCRLLIAETAAAVGCPPEFVALPILVTLGTAIGNSRRLQIKKGWTEGATIFGASIAAPGTGKSPAQKQVIEPAKDSQAKLRKDWRDKMEAFEDRMRSYKIESKQAEKDGEPADRPPDTPDMARTLVGDTTVEALADIMDKNPRGVLINRDELAGWVRGLDQYKGGKGNDRQFYLSLWGNELAQYDRKNQTEPIFLERPFVGLYGSIQPAILRDLRANREDGLLERFLYCYPDRVVEDWSDAEVSDEVRMSYAFLYSSLRGLQPVEDENGDPQPEIATFTEDARALYIEVFNSLQEERRSPGFPSTLDNYWPKLAAYLARLSFIIGMCREVSAGGAGRKVEVRDVYVAAELLTFFKSNARRVYVALYGDDRDERLSYDLARFLADRGGYFEGTPTELYESLQSDYKPKKSDWLTKRIQDLPGFYLEEKHESVKSDTTKTGRTTRRIQKLTLENGINGVNALAEWFETDAE